MIRCDNRFGYLGLHYHVGFSRSPLLIVIYILRVCGRVHRKKILLCFVSLNFFKKMLRAYFDLGSVKIVFFCFLCRLCCKLTLGSKMLRSRLSSRFMVVAVLPVPVLLPPPPPPPPLPPPISRWLLRSRSRSRSCCSSRRRARSTRARVGLSRMEGAREGGRELFAAFVCNCCSCCCS